VSSSIKAALTSNAIIATMKSFMALFTGSASMFAEAIHSWADCGNQGLLLLGKSQSKKEREHFAFGAGKAIFFWSLVVALVLFFVGGVYSSYEGLHKIMHPEPLIEKQIWGDFNFVHLSIIVLLISFFLELYSFRIAAKEVNLTSFRPKAFFKKIKESTNASVIVVLIEDSAAMIGLALALVFTLLAYYVNPVFDGFGSLLIGVLLMFLSYKLTSEIYTLIIGENISREEIKEIKKIVQFYDNDIAHINFVKGMILGSNKKLIVVSVDLNDANTSGNRIEDVLHEIRREIVEKIKGTTSRMIMIDVRDSTQM
jgi:cation diffusion facilitator family transporter